MANLPSFSSARLKGDFALLIGLFCLVVVSSAHAETPMATASVGLSQREILNRTMNALHPKKEDPLGIQQAAFGTGQRGSHLYLIYASTTPIPVIAKILRPADYAGQSDTDRLIFSVLPPSKGEGVLLPVSSSIDWSPWSREGIGLQFFAVPSSNFQLKEGKMVAAVGKFKNVPALMNQLKQGEPFDVSSVNLLHGYSVARIPFVFILHALLFLIALVTAFFFGRNPRVAFVISAAIVLGLYQVRFLPDLALGAWRDLRDWNNGSSYGSVNATPAIGAFIKDLQDHNGELPYVLHACHYPRIPLAYFSFPVPVTTGEEAASHVAIFGQYQKGESVVNCNGIEAKVRILEEYAPPQAVGSILSIEP